MRKNWAIILFCVLGFVPDSFGQYLLDNFSPTDDSYTSSLDPTASFGNDSLLNIHKQLSGGTDVNHSFINFDLSSISDNAIIHKAQLKLFVTNIVDSSDFSLYLERIDSVWNQTILTWDSSPPSLSSIQTYIDSSDVNVGQYLIIDVTNDVEHMTNYSNLNNGWLLRLADELGSSEYGVSFASNNHSDTTKRPILEVGYTYPPEFNILVTHCTPGSNNGAIDVTLSGGGVPYYSVIYEVIEPDTSQAGNSTLLGHDYHPMVHLNDTIMDFSGLSPGVYFLRISDSLYWQTSSNQLRYEFHKYFFVGREGETTEGMLVSSYRFNENSGMQVNRRDTVESITNWGNTNYGTSLPHYLGLGSARFPPANNTEVQYDQKSLIKYNMQFDQYISYDKVDLIMSGYTGFYRHHNSDNAAYFSLVTGPWEEDLVTWNTKPSIDTTFRLSKPTTTTIGYESVIDTVNLVSFFDYWTEHPTENYGIELAQQRYAQADFAGRYYWAPQKNRHFVRVKFSVESVEISGVVKHADEAIDNGEIAMTIDVGNEDFSFYNWKKLTNGVPSILETSSDLNDADIDNLSDGLYVFSLYDSGAEVIDFKYFLVGKQGKTTEVRFETNNNINNKIYGKDAYLKYDKATADGDIIGGDATSFSAFTNTSYDSKSVVKFQIDFDPTLTYISAEQIFRPKAGHFQNSSSSNDAYLSKITEFWKEESVTWNSSPAVDTTDRISLPGTTTNGYESRFDTIDVTSFVNYWSTHPGTNHGVELSLQDYNQSAGASLDYSSSDYSGNDFIITYRLPAPIEATFNETANTGQIDVIAPDEINSYKYLLSYSPLPGLDAIWNNIKDSIDIDSVSFYNSGQVGQSMTFENLEAEEYYVGIYDTNGLKVKEYTTILSSAVDLLVNDNLTFDETGIEASTPSGGRGSLDALFDKNSSGGIQMTVENFGNMTFGLVNANDTIAQQVSDFAFAMNMDAATASLRLFEDGTLLGTFSGAAGDKLRIVKENYDIKFYQNDLELVVVSNSSLAAQDLRADIDFTDGYSKIGAFVLVGQVSKLKIRPAYSKVTNTECGIDNGEVTFQQSWSQYFSNVDVNFTIIDVSTQSTYAIGTINNNTSPTIPLPVGEYLIQYSSTSGQNWTESIFIGNSIEWQLLNTYFTPINNSVNTLTTNSSFIGKAVSNNILVNGELGWVKFNHKLKKFIPPFNGPYSLIGLPNLQVSLINSSSQNQVLVKVTNLSANILNRYVTVYNASNTVVGQIETFSNGPVRIELENNGSNEFHVYGGSSQASIASFAELSTDDYKVSAKGFSSTIYDTYTSFCKGTDNSSVCGHLSYVLDGNYYVTKNGKFCFVYNEEYNDYEIELNIYNDAGNIVATQDNFTFSNVFVHGENRVTLDLSQSGYCIGQGFFILEVINDKKEKFYLRIKNDNSGCTAVPDADNDI